MWRCKGVTGRQSVWACLLPAPWNLDGKKRKADSVYMSHSGSINIEMIRLKSPLGNHFFHFSQAQRTVAATQKPHGASISIPASLGRLWLCHNTVTQLKHFLRSSSEKTKGGIESTLNIHNFTTFLNFLHFRSTAAGPHQWERLVTVVSTGSQDQVKILLIMTSFTLQFLH